MKTGTGQSFATIGVAEHGNSAELVTLSSDGQLLDRRRIDLTENLPTHPYHHEGAWAVGRYRNSPWARDITLLEAVALVEQVTAAAAQGARYHLDQLAGDLSLPVASISIRECPQLPTGIEARIKDNRAQTVADSVMYRQALADAGEMRGWSVSWYNKDQVFDQAASVLGCDDIQADLKKMGKIVGPPWQARHKLAAAAAIVAAS